MIAMAIGIIIAIIVVIIALIIIIIKIGAKLIGKLIVAIWDALVWLVSWPVCLIRTLITLPMRKKRRLAYETMQMHYSEPELESYPKTETFEYTGQEHLSYHLPNETDYYRNDN